MIGDMPPPLPPLLGWRWPRGPFIIPVRTSASPMSASFGVCLKRLFSSETRIRRSSVAILFRHLSRGRKALRPARRRRRVRLSGHARIPNDAMDHESVPDEQHDEHPERRADETGALIEPVPTDGLADERREERACDSQHSGKDEAFRLVRTRRKHARDQAGDEADYDDPDDVPHDGLPRFKTRRSILIRYWAVKVEPR